MKADRTWIGGLAAALLAVTSAHGQEAPSAGVPFLLTAEEITFDRDRQTVTASGRVEVEYADRVLLADTISYDQRNNILAASGNVSLLEPTGEVVFADRVDLTGDLRDGVLHDLRVRLRDNARIAAAGARRSDGNILEMRRAVYSPCNLCPDDPTRPPLWQVKAAKVVDDSNTQTLSYYDSWLEVAGVPVAYTPYFSHPDPTVKRRSGLLAPLWGGSSDLGYVLKVPYYYVIDPSNDLTLTPIVTTEEGPALAGEYRGRYMRGLVDASASVTQDSKNDFRGHVLSKGRFDIDDTWRWGFDANRATDDTYMRRYGYGSQRILASRLYSEGFRGRNYATVNAYAFQGLRQTDLTGEMPIVLPMIEYNHVGEADRLGGRSSLDTSLLALTRTDGTDTRRLAVNAGYRLPYVGPLGDIYALTASLQGDAYQVDDLARPGRIQTFDGATGRVVPQLALDWRYPFVRDEGNVYQLIEPISTVAVSPHGGNPDTIPNEDSQDFEFDDTNLFSPSRFTGLDRVEGGPRIAYGLKWGVFGRGGGSTTVLFGQSYRVKADDTFARDSGLDDHFSDFVNRVQISPNDRLDLLYRARWDKDNLELRRSEIDLAIGPPILKLVTDYTLFSRQRDSEFPTREEIKTSLYASLTRNWRSRFSAVRDLTGEGMRALDLAFVYEDECLVVTTNLARTFYIDRDLKPADSIILRLTFKTLGDLQTSLF